MQSHPQQNEELSLLDAIRRALDAQQWREALDLVDRLPPDDAAAEPRRQEARRGMVQLLYRQAAAAEAKADWADAIALLREAQVHDSSNESIAARIAEDQRVLQWSIALRQSLSGLPGAEAQKGTAVNPAPSLGAEEMARAEDSQAAELEERTSSPFRLLAGAAAVGAVLLVVGCSVALATSGRGMLDSFLHPPTPTGTAQSATAATRATATAVPPVLVAVTPTSKSATPAGATGTSTVVASATRTPTLIPSSPNTSTATPTQSATLAPTQTPSSTSTVRPTETPPPTSTVRPSDTPSPTSMAQPTNTPPPSTPQPTNTPVPSPLPTRQPTPPTPTPAF